MLSINIVPKKSDKYIDSAWNIKRKVYENTGLLKQEWPSFEQIYYQNKVYVINSDEHGLIGYACIDEDNYLSLLVIKPEHQRTGLGRKLIEEIKTELNYIYCHSRISNSKACKFYTNMDFEVRDIEDEYYLNGEDAYIFEYDNKDVKIDYL